MYISVCKHLHQFLCVDYLVKVHLPEVHLGLSPISISVQFFQKSVKHQTITTGQYQME